MEVFVEKINEKEIVFPKNFKYTKTNDGFILDTLSGIEFFKKGIEEKITDLGAFVLGVSLLVLIMSQGYFFLNGYFLSIILIGLVLVIISNTMKKVKTTFIVTPKGIEIKSKKNSLFIKKEDIANIYASQGLDREKKFSYYIPEEYGIFLNDVKLNEYKVFLECKESIRLPNSNIFMSCFDLFKSHFFYTKKSILFLVQEFIRVLDLKLDVIFMNGDEWIL